VSNYVDLDELKLVLGITGTTYDDVLEKLSAAASDAIDDRCETVFTKKADQERVYSPQGPLVCVLDDFVEIELVEVDPWQTGTFSQEWTLGTHYLTWPENHAARKKPIQWLTAPGRSRFFPSFPQSVRVTGVSGWPSVPPGIEQASGLLAEQLWKRRRETPFGILGLDKVTAARVLGRDPHICEMTDGFARTDLVA
jgi:hypothetical protein